MKFLMFIIFLVLALGINAQQPQLYYGNHLKPKFIYTQQTKNNFDNFSEYVMQLIESADRNKDKKISVGELQMFQYRLVREFKYKRNKTALHPNDFVTQGGGDCEDFAIVTTCMLNYYGAVAYVALFGRVTTNKHSLCMVKIATPVPSGYLYYTLHGYGVPKGTYIPVDYDKIGGLKAIDRRWKIARMVRPKQIIGQIW